MDATLETTITGIWERRSDLLAETGDLDAIREAIALLDTGQARVAEVVGDQVVVHEWLKQAILLYFQTQPNERIAVGPFEIVDKVPLKTGFEEAGVRVLPGAVARWGSFIEPGAILMPSFVNIGARVGSGTMVDTWATVGSCAQIGRDVHLSGGVGIGGVLEPPQAAPVIVEDNAFIGSRSMVTEGARVCEGAMLGAGVILNPSIPVVDAETGDEVARGVVPPWCLVINATRPRDFTGGTFGLACALIIKRFAPGERHDKAALNETLRSYGTGL
jgi:2,3,4,5-tetrahydropyridine-2,6-dicarboxylate N-succinyltransferase